MSLENKIVSAFAHRRMPVKLIEERGPPTSEQADALCFAQRAWPDVTWEDWVNHSGAVYAFTPEAFSYYLPGVLILSMQRRDEWFPPADSLLHMLDRSPVVEYWDFFLTTRLVGLHAAEYEVLKEWLLQLSDDSVYGDSVNRSFDTVDLLHRETERLRKIIR